MDIIEKYLYLTEDDSTSNIHGDEELFGCIKIMITAYKLSLSD